MQKTAILEAIKIKKTFNGICALNGVDFALRQGTVHALMGENGAGKSTLMKILAGIYSADSGEIILKGQRVQIRSPKDAMDFGISMIHQELSFIGEMSIAENIFLGREYHRCGNLVVDFKTMNQKSAELLEAVGLNISPNALMKDLTVAEAQMVEIAKAISRKADVIIMDEPTSAITDREVNVLFGLITKLVQEGRSIIYITHKMDEVFQIADEITILRDGNYIGKYASSEINTNQLVRFMVDRELSEVFPPRHNKIGEVSVKVVNLSKKGVISDVSFEAREGEILGFAGLMGAGRTETAECLFGITKKDQGEIYIHGKKVTIKLPRDAINNGIGMVTEDRKRSGLISCMSIKDNMTLVSQKRLCRKGIVRSEKQEMVEVMVQVDGMHIKMRDVEQPVEDLSGGNQQKVIIGKWLMATPDILILDEPTRGIDIGAKSEIYRLIIKMAEMGKTIILISSEMPEIIGLCDRVIVFHERQISGELQAGEITQEEIMKLAVKVT